MWRNGSVTACGAVGVGSTPTFRFYNNMGRFRFYAVKLSLVCLIVFIIQVIFPGFTNIFVLNSKAYWEVWRFLTAIFLHGSLLHLVYNLFALLLFGSIAEKFAGGKKFLIVFFVSGIVANIVSVNFYSSSLGASGAIFGIIGLIIILRPGMMIWAFGLPMPMFVGGILWIAGDLMGAYGFFSGNLINNTGNIAHLVGVFIGLIFGFFYKEKKFERRKYKIEFDEDNIRRWEDFYLR